MERYHLDTMPPEERGARIAEACGITFDDGLVDDLWQKIMDHKWILSEKLAREVGFKAACVDYLDHHGVGREAGGSDQADLLGEMGAQYVSREAWDTIADSQPPKQLVQKRIILPLAEAGLSRKHGVIPPKAIIFFGPPGTGKTHFVKAMAGVLGWWFIEISPSMLMADGVDRIGVNLRAVMEKARRLEEAVVFIDEFEEIAGSRDAANRIDRSITNEFLKQVPLLRQTEKVLLVCATNYVRQLDAALLRPGRFDCVIPVGSLDDAGRKTVLRHYTGRINCRDINLDLLVKLTQNFTPADIGLLCQNIGQRAFEREYETGEDCLVTMEMIIDAIANFRPSLSDEVIKEFKEDTLQYSRL